MNDSYSLDDSYMGVIYLFIYLLVLVGVGVMIRPCFVLMQH